MDSTNRPPWARPCSSWIERDWTLWRGAASSTTPKIRGLSDRRTDGSTLANRLARWSLPRSYRHLSDCMSGFIVLRLDRCLPLVRQVDVNGFKFFYELLAISRGRLQVGEIPLRFQPRLHGSSKLDLAVLWDFVVSLIHTATLRLLPRRAISFGLVGASGVVVQLLSTALLMGLFNLAFQQALPVAVITAASSNYLVNNALTPSATDARADGN